MKKKSNQIENGSTCQQCLLHYELLHSYVHRYMYSALLELCNECLADQCWSSFDLALKTNFVENRASPSLA